jgi:hypothetical protein
LIVLHACYQLDNTACKLVTILSFVILDVDFAQLHKGGPLPENSAAATVERLIVKDVTVLD